MMLPLRADDSSDSYYDDNYVDDDGDGDVDDDKMERNEKTEDGDEPGPYIKHTQKKEGRDLFVCSCCLFFVCLFGRRGGADVRTCGQHIMLALLRR